LGQSNKSGGSDGLIKASDPRERAAARNGTKRQPRSRDNYVSRYHSRQAGSEKKMRWEGVSGQRVQKQEKRG